MRMSFLFFTGEDADTSHWGGEVTAQEMDALDRVKLKPLAQIRFVAWTAKSRLRHAKFSGVLTVQAFCECHAASSSASRCDVSRRRCLERRSVGNDSNHCRVSLTVASSGR